MRRAARVLFLQPPVQTSPGVACVSYFVSCQRSPRRSAFRSLQPTQSTYGNLIFHLRREVDNSKSTRPVSRFPYLRLSRPRSTCLAPISILTAEACSEQSTSTRAQPPRHTVRQPNAT